MSLLPNYDKTFSEFIESLGDFGVTNTKDTKARRIASRLEDAAMNVYHYANGDRGEWGHRRYLHSLRRVALLTYALQHP